MSGLSNIKKTAGYKQKLVEATVPLVAAAVAIKGINSFTDAIKGKLEKRKLNGVIDYAKKKHPELRKVPNNDMHEWMGAFYTLSPKIATNKELGASMLSTVHSYGGNIDLATAKLISEVGEKTSRQHNDSDVFQYMNTGAAIMNRADGLAKVDADAARAAARAANGN